MSKGNFYGSLFLYQLFLTWYYDDAFLLLRCILCLNYDLFLSILTNMSLFDPSALTLPPTYTLSKNNFFLAQNDSLCFQNMCYWISADDIRTPWYSSRVGICPILVTYFWNVFIPLTLFCQGFCVFRVGSSSPWWWYGAAMTLLSTYTAQHGFFIALFLGIKSRKIWLYDIRSIVNALHHLLLLWPVYRAY